jgi:hypothetical protein
MLDEKVRQAAAKLFAAITDEAGQLRPITRIDFQIVDGGGVRWEIWQGSRLLYCGPGRADRMHALLNGTRAIILARSAPAAGR